MIKNPAKLVIYLCKSPLGRLLDDKTYLKLVFRARTGTKLNLDNPVTYNEKLQWLKLYDRNPLYTELADKYKVREYVKERIGEDYLVPLIGQWKNPDDIDFDALPDRFALKCNHNSGRGMFICRDKSAADPDEVKKILSDGLSEDYYLMHREWPYKNIERRIICEKYMEDTATGELRDYKFFCFNGEPKLMYIASERYKGSDGVKFDFYDMDGKHLDLYNAHPNADVPPEIPPEFEEMKLLAKKLSHGLRHVRADFYSANGKIYFSELTFFHMSGFYLFEPREKDVEIGSWLTLD